MDYVHYEDAKPASHIEVVVDRWDAREYIQYHAKCYMEQLIGWCSEEKGAILVDLILKTKPAVVVEIGVFGGKSLVPMAFTLKMNGGGKIYGIDPWDTQASVEGLDNIENISYWSHVDHKGIMNELIDKIFQFNLENYIELIEQTSKDTSPIKDIDILHIDGNHSSDSSYFDVVKWGPLVKSGGWIIFDDITWYENGAYTTARAVEWLDENCIKIGEFHGDNVWGIWTKP